MADDFIQGFIIGEYRISLDATRIDCSYDHQKQNLHQFLTVSINNYITAKSNLECATDEASLKKALEQEARCRDRLQLGLTLARNGDMIIETERMTSKVKKFEEKNNQLKMRYDGLKKKYLELKKENKELHDALDIFGGRSVVEE